MTAASRDIRVGDMRVLDSDDRVPADCVRLHTVSTERALYRESGERAKADATDQVADTSDSLFIRTDETDGKLRRPVALPRDAGVLRSGGEMRARPLSEEFMTSSERTCPGMEIGNHYLTRTLFGSIQSSLQEKLYVSSSTI